MFMSRIDIKRCTACIFFLSEIIRDVHFSSLHKSSIYSFSAILENELRNFVKCFILLW